MKKDKKKDTGRKNTSSERDQSPQERPDQENKKEDQQLTKEDIPDSTNESTGKMGSGLRQDTN